MADFHFSPRPNRAHEINWYDWADEAFDKAEAEKKPILLGISGVWCHWCHVMDETTYSEQAIIDYIKKHYVAIRVDTDQRPDINERYNMGGWPTTAILTSDGDLLTGATYVPPRQMLAFLKEMADLYRDNKQDLHRELAEKKLKPHRFAFTPGQALKEDIVDEIKQEILESYDPQYGGFGSEPKFPMTEALALALYEFYDQVEEKLRDIVLISLRAMAGGGMYDPVEGGFFRYSTTRDWSIPHFEKMLEDNARLLKLLVDTYALTGEVEMAETARDVVRFMENSLYLPDKKAWAGTQDADEEYYSLPMEERNKLEAPFIDKTVYVNWNGLMAQSLMKAGIILEKPRWVEAGLETLHFLMDKCYREDKCMAHFYRTEPELWGLLEDQVEVGMALNLAYEITGEEQWLVDSEKLASFCRENLKDEKGAFMDQQLQPGARGALAKPHFSLEVNARAARWLLELSAITHSQEYKDDAVRALLSFGSAYRRYGIVGGGFGLAAADAVRSWTVVTVTGPRGDKETESLHRAALGGYMPRRAVVVKYNEKEAPKAFPCFGEQCFSPVTHSIELLKVMREGGKFAKGFDIPGPAPGYHRHGD